MSDKDTLTPVTRSQTAVKALHGKKVVTRRRAKEEIELSPVAEPTGNDAAPTPALRSQIRTLQDHEEREGAQSVPEIPGSVAEGVTPAVELSLTNQLFVAVGTMLCYFVAVSPPLNSGILSDMDDSLHLPHLSSW